MSEERFLQEETLGARIRLFLRELLGSRLVSHLEVELLRLRNDMDERLFDKDRIITELRSEKAEMQSKLTSYELTLMPQSSKVGADYIRNQVKPAKPNFGMDFSSPPPISRWQAVVDAHEAELAAEEKAEREAQVTTIA